MNKSRIYIFFILLLVTQYLVAQTTYKDGYVIMLNSDTIKGKVLDHIGTKRFQSVELVENNKKRIFTSDMISGYGVSGLKYFSSRLIKGEFVQVFQEGNLSLYKSKSGFWIKKDSGELINLSAIKSKNKKATANQRSAQSLWKAKLYELIIDCSSITTQNIKSLKLNYGSLNSFVSKYNNCGAPTDRLVSTKDKSRNSIGLFAQLTSTGFSNPSEIIGGGSANSPGFIIGINIGKPIPLQTDKLSINFELSYFHSSNSLVGNDVFYSERNIVDRPQFASNFTSDFKLSTISAPVSIKHYFPLGNLSAYIQAGLSVNYHASFEMLVNENRKLWIQRNDPNAPVENISTTVTTSSSFQLGYLARIGISMASVQNKLISLNLDYQVNPSFGPVPQITDLSVFRNIKRLSVGIEITFLR